VASDSGGSVGHHAGGAASEIETFKETVMKTASMRLWGIAVAGLCLMVRAAMGTCAGGAGFVAVSNLHPLRPARSGPPHFLEAEDYVCDVSTDALMAAMRRRDGELGRIGKASGVGLEWERLWRETAEWRYPHRGDWDGAVEFFRRKTAWAKTMFSNKEWIHNPEHLELAVATLEEILEWRMPCPRPSVPVQPGRDVLRAAGVESCEELPDDGQRATYRKAVEDAHRFEALGVLQSRMEELDVAFTSEVWWHCKQAIRRAEKAGDGERLARLDAIKRRIYNGCPHPYALTYNEGFDFPDVEDERE
jgi:hypothetical protein